MANVIKIKNGTSTPDANDIADKEVAIDLTAQSLYVNDSSTIKQIGLPTTGGTMTGNIVMGANLVDGIDISARDAVLTSTTTTANAALPKGGGTMTGDIEMAHFTLNQATIRAPDNIQFDNCTATDMRDQDDMDADSNTALCSQQSIKAYVDNLPQWVQFPRMSVRMTSQNAYYLGSKSLGTTVGDGDFQPSDFETSNVALFQNMQASGTCSVSQARIFCTYNGAGTDTVEVHYLQLRGAATLGGEFDTATTLTVEKDVNESMELQDDIWYHKSTTINATMGTGDIIVPVFRNLDASSKYLYYSIAYKVYNTLG